MTTEIQHITVVGKVIEGCERQTAGIEMEQLEEGRNQFLIEPAAAFGKILAKRQS